MGKMLTNGYREETLLTQSAFYRLGDCSRSMGDVNQMLVDYSRALAHNPNHPFAPEARTNLLKVYLQRENYDLALQTIHDMAALIVQMTPADAQFWKRRSGEALFRHMFKLRSNEQSLKILDALAELDTSAEWKSQVAEWKGLVHLDKTEWEQALANFLAATDPKNKGSEKTTSEFGMSVQYAHMCQWILDFHRKETELLLPDLQATPAR
jgi:tetratricopeptide (TPR) repeat protein